MQHVHEIANIGEITGDFYRIFYSFWSRTKVWIAVRFFEFIETVHFKSKYPVMLFYLWDLRKYKAPSGQAWN